MVNIEVCIGSACHLKGSYNVINSLQQLIEEYRLTARVEVSAAFCLGHCTEAVSVRIDSGEVQSVSGPTVREFFLTQVLPQAGKSTEKVS
ncbi:MAG: (2Fe-2S) ferredoxin domain-containing protein [Negativicutes bacterium]|nr:(2Fe-2S) ferredoxin domain-containing protein [Negativicutes bacterium]